MRRAAAVLLAALLAASALVAGAPVRADPVPLRIVAVGDSITADGRWQAELDRLLTLNAVPHVIETEAVGGSRCTRWPPLMASILATHQPDLVVIACGTNDDPAQSCWGEPCTTWATRAMIEAVHGYRPANPARILPTLIGMSDPMVVPQWLLDAEHTTTDRLWAGMSPYVTTGWLAGVLDLQRLPATATYLDDGGIHPTPHGYVTIGRLVYRAARGQMGWPDTVLEPCDMYGHRRGYPRPTYTPCPTI